MGKRLKRVLTVSVPAEIFDWLKNQDINVSEYISSFLELEFENKANPLQKIERLEEEIESIQEKMEIYRQKLQTIIEEGNKKEREEALLISDRLEKKEKDEIDRLLSILKELQKHPKWELFVDSFDDMTAKDIINSNEEFNKDGIDTRGWYNLKLLFKNFSKDQLKGGALINE